MQFQVHPELRKCVKYELEVGWSLERPGVGVPPVVEADTDWLDRFARHESAVFHFDGGESVVGGAFAPNYQLRPIRVLHSTFDRLHRLQPRIRVISVDENRAFLGIETKIKIIKAVVFR